MTVAPKESLENFKIRVEKLETPTPSSPTFSKLGWPMLIAGSFIWVVAVLLPGKNFLATFAGLGLIGLGVASIALSFLSAHSEGIEVSERDRLIRERNKAMRCLYLEGNVPDGKGSVGKCRHYEFDMTQHPYCIYCREYKPTGGSPEV